jgi:hypothetical protein
MSKPYDNGNSADKLSEQQLWITVRNWGTVASLGTW